MELTSLLVIFLQTELDTVEETNGNWEMTVFKPEEMNKKMNERLDG